MQKEYKIILLLTLLLFIGCETGVKNRTTTDKTAEYKSKIPKNSEIKKIYSKTGVPGYYIQVGYFKEHKPTAEFINRMEFSQLPYKLLKHRKTKEIGYYALIGPYF